MSPAGCYLALSRFGCPRRGRIPCLERLGRDARFDNSFAGPAAGARHGTFRGTTNRRPASPRRPRHPRGQQLQTSTARRTGPRPLLGARGEALEAANNFDRTSRNTMPGASGTTDCRSPGTLRYSRAPSIQDADISEGLRLQADAKRRLRGRMLANHRGLVILGPRPENPGESLQTADPAGENAPPQRRIWFPRRPEKDDNVGHGTIRTAPRHWQPASEPAVLKRPFASCERGRYAARGRPDEARPGAGQAQMRRSTIIFLISAIAFAGLRPFGQAWVQFMIVWQR